MARFTRLEVLNRIVDDGLVPVFYNSNVETGKKIIDACFAGGAKILEFTNRGDFAYQVFGELVKYAEKSAPDMILGVGSVFEPGTAALYIANGANFVVGPVLNPEVAKLCNRRKIPYSPGCGSGSEISQAEELGVEICKVFPGKEVGGPSFVKAVLGPSPWTRIMPTGGVDTTEESIQAWFKAGVCAVGIGSNLITKELVSAGNFDGITEKVGQVLYWIKKARGENVFVGVEHPGIYPTETVSGQEIADWYNQVFGFAIEEGRSSFFASLGGPGRIEILKEQSAAKCHIAVKVSNFEEAVAALKARGIEIEEPKVKPGTKAAFLKQKDPAGNPVHILWTA